MSHTTPTPLATDSAGRRSAERAIDERPTPPRSSAGGRDSRPLVMLAAVCVAVLAGVLVLMLSRVPPASPDDIERYGDREPLPLLPGEDVRQRLVSRDRDLSRIEVRFGTYGGRTECDVRVRVTGPQERLLDESTIPCADIDDNQLRQVAQIAPRAVGRGDHVALELELSEASDETIAVWAGEPASDEILAEVGTTQGDVAVEAYTRYGESGSMLERLPTVLRRMHQYRPAWGHPVAVTTLAAAIIAGLVALIMVPARLRLAVLLAVVACKGVLWSVLLPPLESPDEPAHVAYAQFVAEEQAIPRRYDALGGRPPYSDQLRAAIEVVHQELPRPSDRPAYGEGTSGPDEAAPDDESARSGGAGNPAAGYAPPYYLGAAAVYAVAPGGVFDVLGTMRLWSVALGVLTVALVVATGRRLFADSRIAIALGVAVAFSPAWTQATTGVNNDAAAIAAGALCTLIALDLALDPQRRILPWLAGVALGAALLSKPFAAAFGPVLLIAWLAGRLRAGGTGRRWFGDVWRAGLGVVATFGVWLALAAARDIPLVTTSDTERLTGARTLGMYVHHLTSDGYHALHINWVERFWGNLSWTDTPISPRAVSVLAWCTLGALVVVGAWLVATAIDLLKRRLRVVGWSGESAERTVKIVVCGSAVLATLALLYYIELAHFLRTGDATLLSGRYALMALPAVIAVPLLALGRLAGRRAEWSASIAAASGAVVLQGIGVWTLLHRFYL